MKYVNSKVALIQWSANQILNSTLNTYSAELKFVHFVGEENRSYVVRRVLQYFLN